MTDDDAPQPLDLNAPAAMAEGATSMLSPENFATRFARGNMRDRRVMRLRELLAALTGDISASAFAEWLEDLAHWIHRRGDVPDRRTNEPPATARLRVFCEALDSLPQQHQYLRGGMTRLFAEARAVKLFTDMGVPSRQGFFSETFGRLSRVLLPDPPVDNELGELLPLLFRSERAVEWFEGLPPELGAKLFDVLAVPSGKGLEPLRRDMRDAALVLSMRIASQGLANDVRDRSPRMNLETSPFYRLPDAVQVLVDPRSEASLTSRGDTCRELISSCRKVVREVHASLEHTGVSVDLVYRLDLIRRQLDRLYSLLGLVAPPGGKPTEGASQKMLMTLVRGALRDRSLSELFRSSTRLLSRRVVEAAAHSGEHYVTVSRDEYHELLDSAGGGGFVTAFTALFKFLLTWAGMAPFWEGFFFSLNYAGSFITMQLMGFSLASKQPAMTAAHLAKSLSAAQASGEHLLPMAKEVARTVRSQLAATIGNLGVVVPVAIAMDLGLAFLMGNHLLTDEYAGKVVMAHHPLKSGVVVGAMVTGVALWISSLAGGTLENWAVYRHLPQAIARQRMMRAVLGNARAQRVADWVLKHISGFGGNLALGFQMGLVPTFAAFFGVPLQLPHVAVSTGQMAFAGAALGPLGVVQPDFLWACVGIVLTGAMNFGVSFALALFVALRSRELGMDGLWVLTRAVSRYLVHRPLDFFRAPKEDVDETQAPGATA